MAPMRRLLLFRISGKQVLNILIIQGTIQVILFWKNNKLICLLERFQIKTI